MAGTSLLALIDDIATLLDDVSVMTKVAAKKTAGVLGDDLALNAQQVAGVSVDRELPVVWAVAKGSAVNKLIIVPAALAISALVPWMVTPLLMLGGLFLCFEGVEKLAHKWLHAADAEATAVPDPAATDPAAFEREKVKGAVRTDFILSAEIVVISLGVVASEPFGKRVAVLAAIAVLMTVGVYGLVAAIVKIDDAGLWLHRRESSLARGLGRALLALAPKLMRFLSVAGTAAMFLVGGGIVVHGIAPVHHAIQGLTTPLGALASVASAILEALVGAVAGALVLGAVEGVKRVRGRSAAH
jgi:uncharacterized protein